MSRPYMVKIVSVLRWIKMECASSGMALKGIFCLLSRAGLVGD